MQEQKGRQGNEGERLQREVLALVLVEHPLQLTLAEVEAGVGGSFEVELAVAALVTEGLLTLAGEHLAPTPAAIRFNELEPIDPPDVSR